MLGDIMVDQDHIVQQIERCRRLATMMTDDELRHSLEELAEQYETQLDRRHAGFMLADKS